MANSTCDSLDASLPEAASVDNLNTITNGTDSNGVWLSATRLRQEQDEDEEDDAVGASFWFWPSGRAVSTDLWWPDEPNKASSDCSTGRWNNPSSGMKDKKCLANGGNIYVKCVLVAETCGECPPQLTGDYESEALVAGLEDVYFLS